jgi:hypothetical protein
LIEYVKVVPDPNCILITYRVFPARLIDKDGGMKVQKTASERGELSLGSVDCGVNALIYQLFSKEMRCPLLVTCDNTP